MEKSLRRSAHRKFEKSMLLRTLITSYLHFCTSMLQQKWIPTYQGMSVRDLVGKKCILDFLIQRDLTIQEYSSYVWTIALSEIIQISKTMGEWDVSELEHFVLNDADGSYLDGYEDYLPPFAMLPLDLQHDFITRACEEQANTGSWYDDETLYFCNNRMFLGMPPPQTLTIPLEPMKSDNRGDISQEVCDEISENIGQAVAVLTEYYMQTFLVRDVEEGEEESEGEVMTRTTSENEGEPLARTTSKSDDTNITYSFAALLVCALVVILFIGLFQLSRRGSRRTKICKAAG